MAQSQDRGRPRPPSSSDRPQTSAAMIAAARPLDVLTRYGARSWSRTIGARRPTTSTAPRRRPCSTRCGSTARRGADARALASSARSTRSCAPTRRRAAPAPSWSAVAGELLPVDRRWIPIAAGRDDRPTAAPGPVRSTWSRRSRPSSSASIDDGQAAVPRFRAILPRPHGQTRPDAPARGRRSPMR